jgi:ferrous iron transport protein A
MNSHNSISLLDVPIGARVRIMHLSSHPKVCTRLRELGFCENAVVRCLTKGYGNIICEICNTRIGLNAGLARGILVSRFD